MVQAILNVHNKYLIPFKYQKEISAAQCTDIVSTFEQFDTNHDGTIDKNELKTALINMGYRDISDDQINQLMTSIDTNQDGVVQWEEFCDLMYRLIKSTDEVNLVKIINKTFGDQAGQTIIPELYGVQHHYALEEVSAASRMINKTLQDVEDLQARLPIDVENPDDLFNTLADGYVGLYLLNAIEEDTIDLSKIYKGHNLNIFQQRANLNAFMEGCKKLVHVIGVDAQSFVDKDRTLMLGVMWQLVATLALKNVTVEAARAAQAALAQHSTQESDDEANDAGEKLADMKGRELLLNWFNQHLLRAGRPTITNFGQDLMDSKQLLYLLNDLNPEKCSLAGIQEPDDERRAQFAINNSYKLGCEDVVAARDICQGNDKVNQIFVAEIFAHQESLNTDDATKADQYPEFESDNGDATEEEQEDGAHTTKEDAKPEVEKKSIIEQCWHFGAFTPPALFTPGYVIHQYEQSLANRREILRRLTQRRKDAMKSVEDL